MSSQSFLWINIGLAVAMAGLFFVGRVRQKAPSRLNLRRGSGSSSRSHLRSQSTTLSPEVSQVSGDEGLGIKNLNVMFLHEGSRFDAHEVLGVPAGARLADVRLAYLRALRDSTAEKGSLIEAAYRAITCY